MMFTARWFSTDLWILSIFLVGWIPHFLSFWSSNNLTTEKIKKTTSIFLESGLFFSFTLHWSSSWLDALWQTRTCVETTRPSMPVWMETYSSRIMTSVPPCMETCSSKIPSIFRWIRTCSLMIMTVMPILMTSCGLLAPYVPIIADSSTSFGP